MKVTGVVLLACIASSNAFSPCLVSKSGTSTASPTELFGSLSDDENTDGGFLSRRKALSTLLTTNAALIFSGVQASQASLLDDFGTDPSKIQDVAKVTADGPVSATPKAASTIEPNLRSNYYYPTNKKRYLPRIKKCNDAIPQAAESIGTLNWEAVEDFNGRIAEDTILPMKLYTSSLSGGGTNVKVSFAKDMMKNAEAFEKSQKALAKAIKKQDQKASSTALEGMATAMQNFRDIGKLTGADGGGDIPSVDEIRRSACRVQGRTFELKVKDRDARLAAASTTPQ